MRPGPVAFCRGRVSVACAWPFRFVFSSRTSQACGCAVSRHSDSLADAMALGSYRDARGSIGGSRLAVRGAELTGDVSAIDRVQATQDHCR
jgi:hypothetical protein